MKTNLLFILLFCFFGKLSTAQEVNRVEVNGKIVVDRNDIEGVTVFNASTNKGTITDKDGKFILEVALNDRIQFAALQFHDFEVVITQNVLDAKSMTVFLVEQVNKLAEVVILPHKLTGNLAVDTESIELVNPNLDALYFGLNNLDKIEFTEDHLSEVNNIALPEAGNRLVNGLNMKNVLGMLVKEIFPPKEKKTVQPIVRTQSILDVYSKEYLKKLLNIKDEDIIEFVYYIEENEFDFSLLKTFRELEFIAFLKSQEPLFVAIKYGKE